MRAKGSESVPAKPFADWLEQRVRYYEERPALRGETGAIEVVVDQIGWTGSAGARRLYRYRNMRSESRRGQVAGKRGLSVTTMAAKYPRDVVEEALHHAGVPFEDLYPDIAAAEALTLEPEKWCPHCRDTVTPIDGKCPWDNWRVGPKTGQRLLGRKLKAAA